MRTRVGVLRGGPSSEYDVSLQTGASVLRHLPSTYVGVDLFLDKEGHWHRNGVPSDLEDIQHHVDVVWNALHGAYGEDGKVQRVLEHFGIPYTGSTVFPSAIAMNKSLTKRHLLHTGINLPHAEVIHEDENLEGGIFRAFQSISPPMVVKPVSGGSSVATKIVRTFRELGEAVEEASIYGDVLVEEYISGREATVPVIDALEIGKVPYVLRPIEILSKTPSGFFDYSAKYLGESEEIYPGRFSSEEEEELRSLAARIHQTLGLRHYSRADFIVSPRRGIYFLEVNTLPGLTEASLLPKALQGEGIALSEFIEHVLSLVHRR